LGLFSPIAKIIASRMLLFPEPFGPDIEIKPDTNCTVVFLNPNDLKPKISTFLICTNTMFFPIDRIIDA
jgi:hypothetical protein